MKKHIETVKTSKGYAHIRHYTRSDKYVGSVFLGGSLVSETLIEARQLTEVMHQVDALLGSISI
jgi:hypothetical protein